MDALCCQLKIDCELYDACTLYNDCESNFLSKRQEMFLRREQFLRDVSASSKKHSFPEQRMAQLTDKTQALHHELLHTYYLSRTGTDVPDGEEKQILETFEKQKNAFLERAMLRAICMGKSTVGFCGRINAGKSSLINDILDLRKHRNELPVSNQPTTAVPTYIIYSPQKKLVFENHRGYVHLSNDMDSLELLKHGEQPCGFPWSSLIRRMYYFANIPHGNVAYVDLPGYSADDVDLDISVQEAKRCNGIIFLVNSHSSLMRSDIRFIKEVADSDIPLLIVLSRVDQIPPGAIQEKIHLVGTQLNGEDIKYKDLIAYSSLPSSHDEYKNSREKIIAFLQECDQSKQSEMDSLERVAINLLAVLAEVIKRYSEGKKEIASTVTDLFGEVLPSSAFDRVISLIRDIGSGVERYVSTGLFSGSFDMDSFRSQHLRSIRHALEFHTEKHGSLLNHAYLSVFQAELEDVLNLACLVGHITQSGMSSEMISNEVDFILNQRKIYEILHRALNGIVNEGALGFWEHITSEFSQTGAALIDLLAECKKVYDELLREAQSLMNQEWEVG